jgi:uncharacterized protein (TIGR02217 family)
MSFDEVELPLKIGFGASGGPLFATEVITIDGGYERRNQKWSQARRKFDARTGVHSAMDAAILLAFFQARAGRARGFRLQDWSDYTSAADGISAPNWSDQSIATGDGATTIFQLIKTYGSGGVTYQRMIRKPVAGSVVVGVNGLQLTTGWTVDTTTGLVTFATSPLAGQAITAGFQFDVPVRFDTDQLNITAEDQRLAKAEIPLIEIRA